VKRFYDEVTCKVVDGGFAIKLDDKPVKTPLGNDFIAPSEALANCIAMEWDAQEGDLKPDSMPLTRLLNTQMDKIGPDRASIIVELMKYAETDPVCYYADAPDDLRAHQKEVWGSITKWLKDEYEIDLVVTFGIAHAQQSEESISRFNEVIGGLSDTELTVFQFVVGITTSINRANIIRPNDPANRYGCCFQ